MPAGMSPSGERGGVFVTGGTGLLGRDVVGRLVASGRPVTALARSEAASRTLVGLGARPVPGDALDEGSLRAGMRGCEVAYHAAGLNAFCLPDPTPLFRVNVDGSRNVIRAAARAGIRRVVYTSSAATLGEAAGTVGREDSSHRGWFLSSYERSKFEGELAVLEEAQLLGVEVVSVNPASVQGRGRTTGTAKLLIRYLNGRLPWMVDTRLSLVDVADCTEGHVLAEARGNPGERYVLAGATLTVREAVELLGQITGIEDRPRALPGPLAMSAAAVIGATFRPARRRAPVCPELVRTLLHGHAYDGSRATRELGLRYTPVEQTLRRAAEWYVQRGLVTRPLPGLAAKWADDR